MVLALQLSQQSQQMAFHGQREMEKRYRARMRSSPLRVQSRLSPVPAKLVGKFLQLEFVNMAELLHKKIEADQHKGAQRETVGDRLG